MSAVVLPVPREVADDERQLPMFSPEDVAAMEEMRRTAHDLLEAVRLQAIVVAGIVNGPVRVPNPRVILRRPKKRHQPLNPRHRTWRGFVEAMRELETIARREHLRLTKKNVCQFGPDSPKTITRTMVESYGLKPAAWPPSTWDIDHPPPAGQL